MAIIGSHSNLDLQASAQMNNYDRHESFDPSGMIGDVGGIDGTPLGVAGFALGALAVLWGLKYLGFRFAFGVSAGR